MHPAVKLEEDRVEVLREALEAARDDSILLGHGVAEPLMHGLVGDEAREVLALGRVLARAVPIRSWS